MDIELTEKIHHLPQKAEADCFVPDQGKEAGRMPALHPASTWNILVPIVRARSALAFRPGGGVGRCVAQASCLLRASDQLGKASAAPVELSVLPTMWMQKLWTEGNEA